MEQIPSLKKILFRYRMTTVIHMALIFLLILFYVFSINRFIVQPYPQVTFHGIISLLSGIFLSYLFLRTKIKISHVLLKDHPGNRIGRFSKKRIIREIDDILSEFSGREKPSIFIIQSKALGPFTIDTLGLNSFNKLNAIYLPEYIFSIMTMEEVKAIILHELGHFNRYIYPLNKFRFPYLLAMPFVPLYFTDVIPDFIFSFFYAAVLLGGFLLQGRILKTDNRPIEFLADYFAAKRIGMLPTINGLISAVRYGAMLEYINKCILTEIKKNRKISLKYQGSIFEKILKKLPSAIVPETRLCKEVRRSMKSQFSKNLPALPNETVEKENRLIDNMLFLTTVSDDREMADWSKFDNIIKNNKIDEEEFPAFIEYLGKNRDKLLIKSANEDPFLIKLNASHPLVRDRILFLYKNREKLSLKSPQ